MQIVLVIIVLVALFPHTLAYGTRMTGRLQLTMEKKDLNDAFTRANRASRSAGAGDRTVEILLPIGLDLDEDEEGNVFGNSVFI